MGENSLNGYKSKAACWRQSQIDFECWAYFCPRKQLIPPWSSSRPHLIPWVSIKSRKPCQRIGKSLNLHQHQYSFLRYDKSLSNPRSNDANPSIKNPPQHHKIKTKCNFTWSYFSYLTILLRSLFHSFPSSFGKWALEDKSPILWTQSSRLIRS